MTPSYDNKKEIMIGYFNWVALYNINMLLIILHSAFGWFEVDADPITQCIYRSYGCTKSNNRRSWWWHLWWQVPKNREKNNWLIRRYIKKKLVSLWTPGVLMRNIVYTDHMTVLNQIIVGPGDDMYGGDNYLKREKNK